MTDLRRELQSLYESVGAPTYEELEARADLRGLRLPKSTTGDLLTGRRLAQWRTVERFVEACRAYAGAKRLDLPAVRFDVEWWRAKYNASCGSGGSRVASGRRSYYSSVIEAFRADHADADWSSTVTSVLAKLTAEPGFVVVAGEAYAGKTALMTKLHEDLERRGFDVVVFYVVQNEADRPIHYLPAVITQLLAVLTARDSAYSSVVLEESPERQVIQYEELWHAYVAGPEPAFLLVDGMDERVVATGSVGLTKLIPMSAGANGRIVLTTRPNPRLDLPRAHPLTRRIDTATLVLAPSSQARAERDLVERELGGFLFGDDPRMRDIAGLIAVAGAVSDREVAELLDFTNPGVVAALREPIARSLFVEYAPDGTPRFRFAHSQIRSFVEETLDRDGAGEVAAMVERILDWADQYASAGWPSRTPRFLREHLPTFIASRVGIGERARRLTALLNDDYRRLSRMTSGSDRAFFQLLELAREVAAAGQDVSEDPTSLFLVEAWTVEATLFTEAAGHTSPIALARVGFHEQALDGVQLISDPARRCDALAHIIKILHEQGETDVLCSAHQVLLTTAENLDLSSHLQVRASIVSTALAIGDLDSAREVLDASLDEDQRRTVASWAVPNLAGLVEAEIAVEFSRSELGDNQAASFLRRQALLRLSDRSPNGEVDTILAAVPAGFARSVKSQVQARRACMAGTRGAACQSFFLELTPAERVDELSAFAEFLAASDSESAIALAHVAHAEAVTLQSSENARQLAVAAAGRVFARAGMFEDAAGVARSLIEENDVARSLNQPWDPWAQQRASWIYDEIACALMRSGQIDEACAVVNEHSVMQSLSLVAIARIAAQSGRLMAAQAIVQQVEPVDRGRVYLGILEGLCGANEHERAREIALQMALEATPEADPYWREQYYGPLCFDLVSIESLDFARRATDRIPIGLTRTRLIAQIEDVDLDEAFAAAWDSAHQGDLASCTMIRQRATDTPDRWRLAAIEALCQFRLGYCAEAFGQLESVAAASSGTAAAVALLMAEAFRINPDETSYQACAMHLAEVVVQRPRTSDYWDLPDDDVVLAHTSLALTNGVEAKLADIARLKNHRDLLDELLLRTCCSLAIVDADSPELATLIEFATSRWLGSGRDFIEDWKGQYHVAEMVKILANSGQVTEAYHLANAITKGPQRAEALSAILPNWADLEYDTLWTLVSKFRSPSEQVRAVAKAVATKFDPSGSAYQRSVYRMFDAVRSTTSLYERWEALGHLAIALLPAFPECLHHHLSRRIPQVTPVYDDDDL